VTASATLLTAMRQPGAMPLWVLELGTGSSKLRFCSHYYASSTDGLYHGKVLSWGGWSRALADRSYSLETVSTSVTIADTDKVIAALVAGGVLGGLTLADADKARSDPTLCPDNLCSPAGREVVNGAETKGLVSTILLAAGGVMALRMTTSDL
jgi:hypothetical protein